MQYAEEEGIIMGVDVKQGIKAAVLTASAAAFSSNPSALYSILNTIQMIIFMPLNSVKYPEKLRKLSSSLIVYNVVPNFFGYCFDSNSTSVPYREAYQFGIQSSVIFLNAGALFTIFFAFLFILGALIAFEKMFPKNQKLAEMKLKSQFGLFLTVWIQGYLEFGIYSIIQLKSVAPT